MTGYGLSLRIEGEAGYIGPATLDRIDASVGIDIGEIEPGEITFDRGGYGGSVPC